MSGQRGVVGHRLLVRETPHTYASSKLPFPQAHHSSYSSRSYFPTARVLFFSLSHPPPLPDTHAPSLSPRDTSAVTISQGKGSDSIPNATASGTSGRTTKRRERLCISFGVAYLVVPLLVFPSLFRYLQYMGYIALENWYKIVTSKIT